jgi:transposase-like protein
MNIHHNARLTPLGRERMVRAIVEGGQTPQAAARVAGVCPRTARKWVDRFKAEGLAGLADRSSRPQRLRQPTSPAVVDQVIALRRRRLPGQHIAKAAGVSPATVSRILKRAGLSRLRDLEPPEPVRRYERQHPGELIHIDIKKLGRFHQVGHRITGDRRRQSNARSRGEGAGWEFVHVCIDDASRIAFTMIMPDEKAKSATAFLKAAVAYYNSLGVTVAGVMTDNGSCYKAFAFDRACKGSSSSTSAPGPTHPRPTARPSASSRPRCGNGLMPSPTTPQTNAPNSSSRGPTPTIGIARTAA